MSAAETRARMRSTGGWGAFGDGSNRHASPVQPRSRKRCGCGCGRRATHLGWSNGVVLTVGCELSIRRWVKEESQ